MQHFHIVILALAALAAQDAKPAAAPKYAENCPLHAQHLAQKESNNKKAEHAHASADDQRFSEMNARGTRAMGFDQAKTTHHFRTLADGGAIEVTVNDPADAANLTAIRTHLRQVAKDFSRGDFRSPLATHGELPTGTEAMQAAKGKIVYRYEELAGGGRVRITTKDTAALNAVHQFLGYQVTEHRTGDAASEHKH